MIYCTRVRSTTLTPGTSPECKGKGLYGIQRKTIISSEQDDLLPINT